MCPIVPQMLDGHTVHFGEQSCRHIGEGFGAFRQEFLERLAGSRPVVWLRAGVVVEDVEEREEDSPACWNREGAFGRAVECVRQEPDRPFLAGAAIGARRIGHGILLQWKLERNPMTDTTGAYG